MRAIFKFLIVRLIAAAVIIGSVKLLTLTPWWNSIRNREKINNSHSEGQFGIYYSVEPPQFRTIIKGEVILETEPLRDKERRQFQKIIVDAVKNGGGMEKLDGSYRDGKIKMKVTFHGEGTIDDWAEVVRERLEQAKDKFPQGAIMPTMQVDYGLPNLDGDVNVLTEEKNDNL